MAQIHTALRAISRLRWKPQRGSHSKGHLSPHPGPLPRGEGACSAGLQQNPARFLPDELPEQPNLPPTGAKHGSEIQNEGGRMRISFRVFRVLFGYVPSAVSRPVVTAFSQRVGPGIFN